MSHLDRITEKVGRLRVADPTLSVSDPFQYTPDSRIVDGVNLLFELKPNWLDFVKENELDMGSEFDDLLGQIYGSYSVAVKDHLLISHEISFMCGFNANIPESVFESLDESEREKWMEQQLDTLTQRWKLAIKRLKEKKNDKG